MWNMTQDGFVSIVYKGGGLQVRSRDRKSIERFCDLAGVKRSRIVEGGGTDYQFRVRRVSKKDVKRYVCAVVDGIDYDNFKNRVTDSGNKRYAKALGRVWSVMWDVADLPKRVTLGQAYTSSSKGYESPYADAEWWYSNFPKRDASKDAEDGIPTITQLMDMPDDERREVLNELDMLAREGDDEVEDLLVEVERLLEADTKSIHDMTEDEWRAMMEETGGV